MNITATIHSATAISLLSWRVVGGDIPPGAKNYTYTRNDAVYSILSLYDLYLSDKGDYEITVWSGNEKSVAVAHITVEQGIATMTVWHG